MSKINGSALMFDEEEIKATAEVNLPRLIRLIFFAMNITNEEYLHRYKRFYKENHPDKSPKEFVQKSSADRKAIVKERHKLTFNLMRHILAAMGYDVECVSVRIRDRLTGDVKTFSTDDNVEKLKLEIEKSKEIGVQSITM